MKPIFKLALICAPIAFVAACGGGDDLADRLDLANPTVRFVHASPLAPNVTLYRGAAAQSQATNVPYKYASNYYDIDTSAADWSVQTSTGNVTIGSVNIDPKRGNRYTIVALPASNTASSLYVINDPYNKALDSTKTRLRVMNASFNTPSIDVYLTKTADITAVTPQIGTVAYKTSGPKSTDDSFAIAGDTYQLRITATGQKTALFTGTVAFGNNQDVLILTVPDASASGGIKALVKVGELALTDVAP